MGFKDLVAGAMNWHKTINDNNAEAETRIGSLERNLYNSNLLINGYFDVWQRGDNERPDMFKITYGFEAEGNVKRLNANTNDNCLSWEITKENITTMPNLSQFFSKEDFRKWQDKWIAVTVEVEATKECPCIIALFNMGPVDYGTAGAYRDFTITTKRKRYTTYFKLTDVTQGEETGHVQVIRLNKAGYTGTINVYSVEMVEVDAPNSALMPKVIKTTYNEELRKCQYYLQKIHGGGFIGNGIITAITTTTSYAVINIPLPTNMRINYPTLTYNNIKMELYHRPALGSHVITDLRFAQTNAKNGMVSIDVGINRVTGLSVGDPVMILCLNTDDYILLSAEL